MLCLRRSTHSTWFEQAAAFLKASLPEQVGERTHELTRQLLQLAAPN